MLRLGLSGWLLVMLAAAAAGQESSPGEQAQTSMFGIDARGSKFVYVIDRSGSMGIDEGRPMATAKAELLRSIDKLDTVQQFQIIFYNERPQVFNPSGRPGRWPSAPRRTRPRCAASSTRSRPAAARTTRAPWRGRSA